MDDATNAQILQAVNTLALNVATKEDVKRVEEQICEVDRLLFRGNSHPPLVHQVRQFAEEWEKYKVERANKTEKKQNYFLEKLLAPVITGLTVALTMLIIAKFFVK